MHAELGLLLLADARLPTGAHAHAAGVEAAVRVGDVRDLASLERYLRARLETTGRVDAAFAAAACHARSRGAGSAAPLHTLDIEYSAWTPSPYLRRVSRQLGRQLLRTAGRVWPAAGLDALLAGGSLAPSGGDTHQALALGAVAAGAGAGPHDAAALAIHHLAGAVATGGVRLLGLDPTESAAIQLRAATDTLDRLLPVLDPGLPPTVDLRVDLSVDLARLPADGGLLTEILGEHHGSLDARLFVA